MKTLNIALPAMLASALFLSGCTDRQDTNTNQRMGMGNPTDRAEELYSDARNEMREARNQGRICLSALDEMRGEWSDFYSDVDMGDLNETDRGRLSDWGDELSEMWNDMGDIVDRSC